MSIVEDEVKKLLGLVHIDTNTDGCWEWLGSRTSFGYGQFSSKTLPRSAHRAVWTVLKGEIPKGLLLCHRCDNPPCCNPAHIFLGTHLDNMKDMLSKNRHWKGELNTDSKGWYYKSYKRSRYIPTHPETPELIELYNDLRQIWTRV